MHQRQAHTCETIASPTHPHCCHYNHFLKNNIPLNPTTVQRKYYFCFYSQSKSFNGSLPSGTSIQEFERLNMTDIFSPAYHSAFITFYLMWYCFIISDYYSLGGRPIDEPVETQPHNQVLERKKGKENQFAFLPAFFFLLTFQAQPNRPHPKFNTFPLHPMTLLL